MPSNTMPVPGLLQLLLLLELLLRLLLRLLHHSVVTRQQSSDAELRCDASRRMS